MTTIVFKNTSALLLILLFLWNQDLTAQTPQKTVSQWVALAKSGEKNLVKANFTGSDLTGIDLHGTDLSGANLTGTNLSNANLTDCRLYNSNLTGVNFTGANLTRANFLATNMQYVNLRNANLQQALLQEANLEYAILNGANLQSANLLLAILKSADLQGANLTNAVLDYSPVPTQASKSVYSNDKKGNASVAQNLTAPEMVETEALSKALDLLDQNINVFVRLNGAKINKNTKGLDFLWAKKNGAMIVAATYNEKTIESAPSNSIENVKPASKVIGTHTVVSGDTLFNISKRYNITVSQLKEWNNLSDNIVSIGQVLKVSP